MRKYRYRTSALTGPWLDSQDEARRDAIRAKQAVAAADDSSRLRWIVPGRIEERVSDEAPTRLSN